MITFIAASPEQAPILASLHAESFGAANWSLQQMQGSLDLATTQGWIAMEGATPIGFILCQSTSDQAEILTLCVKPDKRRNRIGEKLLQTALGVGGYKNLFLEVSSDNHAARKLYEKLGFVVTGTRPNYYHRGDVTADAIMYALSTD